MTSTLVDFDLSFKFNTEIGFCNVDFPIKMGFTDRDLIIKIRLCCLNLITKMGSSNFGSFFVMC